MWDGVPGPFVGSTCVCLWGYTLVRSESQSYIIKRVLFTTASIGKIRKCILVTLFSHQLVPSPLRKSFVYSVFPLQVPI